MTYCTRCGAGNDTGDPYCGKCGHRFAPVDKEPNEAVEGEICNLPNMDDDLEYMDDQDSAWDWEEIPKEDMCPEKTQLPTNGLATAGFVLGIVALVFVVAACFFPFIAMVLSVLGLIFSACSKIGRYRYSTAGLVLNILAFVLSVLFMAIFISACNDALLLQDVNWLMV